MTVKRTAARRVPVAIAAAALVGAALTGCSAASAAETCWDPGEATSQVKVSGEFAQTPDVSFPTPLYAEHSQSATAIEGDGMELTGSEVVMLDWSIFNGRTGKQIDVSDYDGAEQALDPTKLFPGMTDAISCHTVGSRVVATVTPEDGLGDKGNPIIGVDGDDTLVLVIDIEKAFPSRATGTAVPVVQSGLPSVVTAPDGTPGLTIPNSAPPSDAKHALLKRGSGPELTSSSTALVQVQQASWTSQSITQSTWDNGTPSTVTVGEAPAELKKALTGATVGSQVIAVVPEDDDASIFVIDVLGTL